MSGLIIYAYVEGNPVSYTDPLGLRKGAVQPKAPDIGVFGCIGLACLTSTPKDSEPQLSLEPTLGGGIEICDPAPPKKPKDCNKNCGMYDANCDNQVQLGSYWPKRFGGLFFGPSFKRDGRFCLRIGPHAGVPFLPSIELGGISE